MLISEDKAWLTCVADPVADPIPHAGQPRHTKNGSPLAENPPGRRREQSRYP